MKLKFFFVCKLVYNVGEAKMHFTMNENMSNFPYT